MGHCQAVCGDVLNTLEHHASRKCHPLCIVVFSHKAVAGISGAGLCFALQLGESVTAGCTMFWRDRPDVAEGRPLSGGASHRRA